MKFDWDTVRLTPPQVFLVNGSEGVKMLFSVSAYHSTGGPWQIRSVYRDPVIDEVMKAAEDLGYSEIDHNGPYQDGNSIQLQLST